MVTFTINGNAFTLTEAEAEMVGKALMANSEYTTRDGQVSVMAATPDAMTFTAKDNGMAINLADY